MQLITSEIDRKLRFYYRQNLSEDGLPLERGRLDPYPPLKLFTPWGAATWLISERDDEEPEDRAIAIARKFVDKATGDAIERAIRE